MKKGFRIVKFKKKQPVLEVRDLTKSFDGRTVLEKINLKLYQGQCLGLLGPNGSGKTSLFKIAELINKPLKKIIGECKILKINKIIS